MFGPGMPILFLIGMVHFIVLYSMERITLAKYYRMPTNFATSLPQMCSK